MADENSSPGFAGDITEDLKKALEGSLGASDQQDESDDDVQAQADTEQPTTEPEQETEEAEPEQEADSGADDSQDDVEPDEGEADQDDEEEPDEDLTKELSHLPQDVRDQFADLDNKAQRLVLDRYKHLEARADKKFQEASGLRKTADEQLRTAKQFDDVLKPYEQHLAEAGLSPAQAVRQVLAHRDNMVQDPVAGLVKLADEFMFSRGDVGSPRAQQLIRQLAKKARVDLEGLDDLDDDAPSAQSSSREAELIAQQNARIEQLSTQVQDLTTGIRTKETSYGEQVINEFMANPENRFAGELTDQLAHFVNLPEAQAMYDPKARLQWAYDQAVWANPDTRQRMLDAERAKEREQAEAKLKDEQEKARAKVRKVPASKAKAASTTPKSVAPVAKASDADLSLYDALKNGFDEQMRDGASRI